MDDHDRDNGQIPEEIEQFDFEQLPIPTTSVWVLYEDIIRWLSLADQEFLLVCRLVAGNKKAACKLTGLNDEAFDKCKTRIRARCKVIARLLETFKAPGEYLLHTKERLEGLVFKLSMMDSKMHPGTFDDAVEMAKRASPVPLQRVVHSEETQCIRKLLLTLYGRRNAV